VKIEHLAVQPRCPGCHGPLVSVDGIMVRHGMEPGGRPSYWCPAGCRGPEADGMFVFMVCPTCGSHDTTVVPRDDGVDECECHRCGSIVSLQTAPPAV
jgi:Zn finger protein HypA/HybF involved in hydrogenase expression